MKTETVPASAIQHGDTILINGEEQTVSRDFIKNGFHGTTLYGQRFPEGVQRVLFPKWFQGEITGWHAQI